MMEIDRRELKRQAREDMRLPVPRFWLVTLVYLLATTGVSVAMDFIPTGTGESFFGFTSLFLSILVALYTTVVRFGYQLWCLWTHRRLDPGMGSLMQGFSVSGRVILMEIHILLGIAAWSLALALGAGIPMGVLFLLGANSPALLILLLILWGIIIYIASTMIQLRYCLAPYLLADDPDAGAGSAVRRSVELTRGWKWELFKLELSFLGWDILNVLLSLLVLAPFLLPHLPNLFTLGLDSTFSSVQTIQMVIYDPLPYILSTLITLPLSLWLEPYRTVTRAGFYDVRLQAQRDNAPLL